MVRRTLKEQLVQRILDELSKKPPYVDDNELLLNLLRVMEDMENENKEMIRKINKKELTKRGLHNVVPFRSKKK
jgi:hypothetical protein|tara:strand:+ start:546 stop:767 length:222 start_codon:yes stop_codon:yes gene_type:complete